MNLKQALEVAERLEDEGVVSTVALALRCLAREYVKTKTELDELEFKMNKDKPALLRPRNNGWKSIPSNIRSESYDSFNIHTE